MKLYYTPGACSLAVRIVLNELGLDYESVKVDLRSKKTEKGEDFLKINDKGSVPALALDNGHLATEAATIQQYLAETYQNYDLLPEIGAKNRYSVLKWLNYVATEMHKGVGIMFNPNIPEEVKTSVFLPAVRAKLDYLDKHLAETKTYIAGENFTLADAYLFTILTWLPHFNVDISKWPNLKAYMTKIAKRPAVELSFKQEELPSIA